MSLVMQNKQVTSSRVKKDFLEKLKVASWSRNFSPCKSPEYYCRVRKNTPLELILSQLNPDLHALLLDLF
jgi:hypothetical protein